MTDEERYRQAGLSHDHLSRIMLIIEDGHGVGDVSDHVHMVTQHVRVLCEKGFIWPDVAIRRLVPWVLTHWGLDPNPATAPRSAADLIDIMTLVPSPQWRSITDTRSYGPFGTKLQQRIRKLNQSIRHDDAA